MKMFIVSLNKINIDICASNSAVYIFYYFSKLNYSLF